MASGLQYISLPNVDVVYMVTDRIYPSSRGLLSLYCCLRKWSWHTTIKGCC